VGALRRIRGATNPGEFSYARYLARQGIRTEAFVAARGLRRWEPPQRRTLTSIVSDMRDTARLALHRTMPGPNKSLYAGLVASMVYGVTAAPLPREIVEKFRQSGTIHVLVVSGAQISILAMSLLYLLRTRREALHWGHALLVLPVLGLFALMVGYGPSVRRAVGMCMLLLFAGASRRDYDAYTALAVAAVIVVLLDPTATADVGAQLSFAAALGVIHFAPRRRRRPEAAQLHQEPRWLWYGRYVLYASFGAWAMVLPVLAHHFHSFPTLSGVSNLVVVPLSAVLVVTGFIATGAALVFAPAAVALNWLNRHLVDAVLGAVRVGAALPFGYETSTYMSVLAVVLWYATLLAVVGIIRSEWREHLTWSNVVLAVLIVAAVALAYHAVTLPPSHLGVTLLDVGDGDCIVVRSPTGAAMLVDAGERLGYGRTSDVAERVVLPYLLMHGIRRLDYIVVTHGHDDHISGLPTVLAEMPVGQVVECGLPGESAAHDRYVAAVRASGARRRIARPGARIDLGGGAVATVLAPAQPFLRGTDDDLNNNCIVLKLVYGDVSFLLTGDLEAEGQSRLRRSGANLRSTVLKAPHHGAEESCTPEFLEAVSPEWALISAGSPRLGHPSPETITRLQEVGAKVLRTDVDGAITVETDGSTVRVRTFAATARR
jgi:competence protein ComEC